MRVVIGEDEALLRQGPILVLQQGGFDIVADTANAADLVRSARQHKPDLVVTNIRMPPTFTDEGLVAALDIHRTMPETAIVVLSQHVQRRYAMELLTERPAGVGYLLKQRIADIAGSAMTCGVSALAEPSSTPRSSPSWSRERGLTMTRSSA